ncbi:GNAT family N-acetyltransferase [Croceimicrobium hydrocarbonivorans]|uniref:GNAT family N-acetyltransferase n=1 Tax=Croceimicrobium hydrocarbonivorans TaxID=2761580 RepID=A0A7H0VGP6_9FLAO|nr:GNAT family N-acetyltransferase [Croceimicrobium hydrocarbonivorans]QNR24894.1 GNAT family N-acetyltransferase [Croceimicrobium hydrocarbonivorans]
MKNPNLYNMLSLWQEVGQLSGQYFESRNWAAAYSFDSHWPNRIWLKPDADLENLLAPDELSVPLRLVLWQNEVAEQKPEVWGWDEAFRLTAMSSDLNDVKAPKGKLRLQKLNSAEDYKNWSQLFEEAFAYRYSPNLVASTHRILDYYLAFEGNQAIGTIAIYRDTLGGTGLYSMGVPARFRRRGFAQEILRGALNFLKEEGHQKVYLQASEMGRPLYLQNGFQSDFEIIHYQ